MLGNIKNIVKKIGFTAAALALAAGLASAPAASASSLSSDSTSIVANVEDVSTGKLVVYVGTMSASPVNVIATVTVYNEVGMAVAQSQTTSESNAVRFGLAEGVYKVVVTAKGYNTAGDYAKIAADYTTEMKVLLTPRTSNPGGIATR